MAEPADMQSRNWGMFCHLSSLCIWLGVPFGNIIGPLLIWLLKKDELPVVEEHGKESLNFQISISAYFIVAIFLAFFIIGIPLIAALALAHIVLVIIATVKASNGESYRYPFTFRLIK